MVEPVDLTPTIQQQASPQSLAYARALAEALRKRDDVPQIGPFKAYGWANGVNDALGQVLGAWQLKKADQAERGMGHQGANNLSIPLLPGENPGLLSGLNNAAGNVSNLFTNAGNTVSGWFSGNNGNDSGSGTNSQ